MINDTYLQAICRHNTDLYGEPEKQSEPSKKEPPKPFILEDSELPLGAVKVPEYPWYFATPSGHVFTTRKGRIRRLKETEHHPGYLYVSLTDGSGHTKSVPLHRVIAMTFLPNPDGLRDVNHKNMVKNDNRLENLEWVSHADNCRHARNGGHSAAKLTDSMRAEIYSSDLSDVKLADKFGVAVSTVRSCRIGKTYKGAKPVQMILAGVSDA